MILRIFTLLVLSGSMLNAQNKMMLETTNGNFSIIDQGEGVPVLLLHGFPDSKELWKHQTKALVAAGYRVIAPDLRGYGNSPRPLEKEKYAMPILVSDVIAILDALELDKVHLVGHDWGASLSWTLAQYYQPRFYSLTVMSVGYPGGSAWSSLEQRQKSWYFYLFLQEGLAEKTLADNDWKFTREAFAGHKNLEEVIERFQKPNALKTALNWYRGNLQGMIARPDIEYKVSNDEPQPPQVVIKIPVLGIWSSKDFALSESQMKQSKDFASDFTYKKVEGASHWMMLDRPKEVNGLLLDFLGDNE